MIKIVPLYSTLTSCQVRRYVRADTRLHGVFECVKVCHPVSMLHTSIPQAITDSYSLLLCAMTLSINPKRDRIAFPILPDPSWQDKATGY